MNVVIILIIVVLIGFQLFILLKTHKKSKVLASVFETTTEGYKVEKYYIPKKELSSTTYDIILSDKRRYKRKGDDVETYEDVVFTEAGDVDGLPGVPSIEKKTRIICKAKDKEEVSLISLPGENPLQKEINRVLNNYLIRNKGAASDYGLIKDVVERNCNSLEEEIETQTPWPLYFGLMGTMLGIIVGIGDIAINVGFDQFVEKPEEHIGGLMGDVAMAMIVSCCGILFTTTLSFFAKKAKSILETRKNAFYSWFQSELMPIISKENASTGLKRLEENLSKFNESFEDNVKELNATFSVVKETSGNQALLMKTLNKMDLKKMAEANIEILSRFNQTVGQLEKFNSYINYSQTVLDDIAQRNTAISEATISVDSNLDKALNELKNGVEQQMSVLRDSLRKSEEEMEKLVACESRLFANQDSKINAFFDSIQSFKPLIEGINSWKKDLKNQTMEISRLVDAISQMPLHDGDGGVVIKEKKTLNPVLISIVAVVVLLLGGNMYYSWKMTNAIKGLVEVQAPQQAGSDTLMQEVAPTPVSDTVVAATEKEVPAVMSKTKEQLKTQPQATKSSQKTEVRYNKRSSLAY